MGGTRQIREAFCSCVGGGVRRRRCGNRFALLPPLGTIRKNCIHKIGTIKFIIADCNSAIPPFLLALQASPCGRAVIRSPCQRADRSQPRPVIHCLGPADLDHAWALDGLFRPAFEDAATCGAASPSCLPRITSCCWSRSTTGSTPAGTSSISTSPSRTDARPDRTLTRRRPAADAKQFFLLARLQGPMRSLLAGDFDRSKIRTISIR